MVGGRIRLRTLPVANSLILRGLAVVEALDAHVLTDAVNHCRTHPCHDMESCCRLTQMSLVDLVSSAYSNGIPSEFSFMLMKSRFLALLSISHLSLFDSCKGHKSRHTGLKAIPDPCDRGPVTPDAVDTKDRGVN